MDIHEHQAKELLRQYHIPTPSGYVAFTTDEAIKAAKKLPGPIFVVKAQIHAGGRGKAGGVKILNSIGYNIIELIDKKLPNGRASLLSNPL